jgi:spoIIIJ-associated protein
MNVSSNVDDDMGLEGADAGVAVEVEKDHAPPSPRARDDEDDDGEDPTAGRPRLAPVAPADFTEDGRADDALDFVVAVLSKMGLDCTVDLMENDENDPPTDVRIEVNGRDANRLIGRKGQTLSALQFLANRVINRPDKTRRHVLIDADGYRSRREQALSSMAQRLGKQAVAEGKIITFEPMSAQDRRVVHLALAKFPGVVTKSEGKGATRRVQIIPVRE